MTDITGDLKRDEGFVGHAYQDSEGFWTIGFGRMIDERLGGGITEDEASILLENDLRRCLADLDRVLPWWRGLTGRQARGLLNMCFNLGIKRLLSFKKMLVALQAHDGELAAKEAKDSKWARQVGARANRVAALFQLKE